MLDDLLTRIFAHQWTVFLVTAALLLALAEAGFRFGLRLDDTRDKARKNQIGGIQGAVLSMLGLLLGFTFAMAADRYDKRRGLVLQEANAVGATYLARLASARRAPGPGQGPVAPLHGCTAEVQPVGG